MTAHGQIQMFLPLFLNKRGQSFKAIATDPFRILTGKGNERCSEMIGPPV